MSYLLSGGEIPKQLRGDWRLFCLAQALCRHVEAGTADLTQFRYMGERDYWNAPKEIELCAAMREADERLNDDLTHQLR